MAPNATIIKAELQITDMDRHYYASHNLVLAQHPSETPERLMVRLLAFALHADERLEFGRGLSNEDEAALCRRDDTGDIVQWIDVGLPDESRIRKACARARQVIVVTYGGRAADLWWSKNAAGLSRFKNLSVIDLDDDGVDAVTTLFDRGMRLTAMIQDGELQLMSSEANVALRPTVRMAPVSVEA